MSEEKPQEKKKYVKPDIQERGSLDQKFSMDGFDGGIWGECGPLKLKEDVDVEEKEAYISRELGAVIMDYETSKYYETNDTGTFIVKLIQSSKTAEVILETICKEYEVDQATARADLNDFLEKLKKFELLEE